MSYYVLNDKKFPPGTPVGFYATLEEAQTAAADLLVTLAGKEDLVSLEIYSIDPTTAGPNNPIPTKTPCPLEGT